MRPLKSLCSPLKGACNRCRNIFRMAAKRSPFWTSQYSTSIAPAVLHSSAGGHNSRKVSGKNSKGKVRGGGCGCSASANPAPLGVIVLTCALHSLESHARSLLLTCTTCRAQHNAEPIIGPYVRQLGRQRTPCQLLNNVRADVIQLSWLRVREGRQGPAYTALLHM